MADVTPPASDDQYFYADFETHPDPPHQPMYLDKMLARMGEYAPHAKSVLDAGCGDGNFLESVVGGLRVEAYGLDGSASGIRAAQKRGIGAFEQGSLYQSWTAPFGVKSFDVVISVEVIEHLYDPRGFVREAEAAVAPGGLLILTTPYWGYFKNVGIAVTGRVDRALTPLWDGGHIKHWSRKTLTSLVSERNFVPVAFDGSGGDRRPPFLWRGMMLTFRRIQ